MFSYIVRAKHCPSNRKDTIDYMLVIKVSEKTEGVGRSAPWWCTAVLRSDER